MEFPMLVYSCPGEHQCKGGTFNYRGVNDEEQLVAALKDGWFQTVEVAMNPPKIESSDSLNQKKEADVFLLSEETIPEKQEEQDNAPPTREELEQKAIELGLKFDGRTSDKKLGDLIAAALKA